MQLERNLTGLRLSSPLMIAAGCCKTEGDVRQVLRTGVAAVVIGSITTEPRAGNEGITFWSDPAGVYALNSLGLPNPGMRYWQTELPALLDRAHRNDQHLIVSVAGFGPQEFGVLTAAMLEAGADAVELNLGCPNLWQDGDQKPIFSFDTGLIVSVLTEVTRRVGADARIGVKLSPYSDPTMLLRVGATLALFPVVKYIATSNTFPNGLAFVAEKRAIAPAEGKGGVGGAAMKPIALGQVAQFHALLPDMPIVGTGGINSAHDVDDYLTAGATATALTTTYWNDPSSPKRIMEELMAMAETA